MPIKHIAESLLPTKTKYDVPKLFHEPHVETGFRDLHQPWSYYFYSLLQKHNECMNVWTHLVALIVIIGRTIEFSQEYQLFGDRYMWPLTAGLLTTILLYICSCLAHLLSNKSELVHYTCFMVDYAGIGLYGTGSVILHYAYCADETFFESYLKNLVVPVGIFLGAFTTFCCSYSKVKYCRPYPFTRKIWQLSGVGAVYAWLILPIVHRIYMYVLYDEMDKGLLHHISQMAWMALGGFFFSSDIPQRFFPGKFDFLGHSHQFFHVCIMMTSYKQLDGIYEDLHIWKYRIHRRPPPLFWDTFGAIGLVIFANAIILLVFRELAKRKIQKEREGRN